MTISEGTMSKFSPMLASPAVIAELRFPLMASPKLDGVRAVHWNGQFSSRTLKPFRNRHVMAKFNHIALSGMDGEMVLGSPVAKDVFIATNSALSTMDGEPEPVFYVFDLIDLTKTYSQRLLSLMEQVRNLPPSLKPYVKVVEQKVICNHAELESYEQAWLDEGYEGLMVRGMHSPYKFGRSTATQGWLLKVKRFQDDEAQVLEVVQQFKNGNEARTNALGHTERSSHQEHMIPQEAMGAIKVRDLKTGVVFQIGTGFTAAQRREWWANRASKIGVFVKYQHFVLGNYDLPRFPSFKGERMAEDIIV